jgi:hypothetical protein
MSLFWFLLDSSILGLLENDIDGLVVSGSMASFMERIAPFRGHARAWRDGAGAAGSAHRRIRRICCGS